jgi:uncharacterized protein
MRLISFMRSLGARASNARANPRVTSSSSRTSYQLRNADAQPHSSCAKLAEGQGARDLRRLGKVLCSRFAPILPAFVPTSFLFFVIGLANFGLAYAQPEVPPLSGPVIDQADMLTSGEEGRLESRISELFASGGPQMQVWTFPTLKGDDIAPVGIRAADAWKIGRDGKDDGVILLIAQRERRTRLEVGRGLEGVLPDVLAGRILSDVLRPALRGGQTYEGILGVVGAVDRVVRGESLALAPGSNSPLGGGGGEGGVLARLLPALVPLIFLFLLVSGIAGRGGRRRRGVAPLLFPGVGGGGWGGGSWRGGGGGGGWSGGGGGFGGGGASGNW